MPASTEGFNVSTTTASVFESRLFEACTVARDPQAKLADRTQALAFIASNGPLTNEDSCLALCHAVLTEFQQLDAFPDQLESSGDSASIQIFDKRSEARTTLKVALEQHYDEEHAEARERFLKVEASDPSGPFVDIAYAVQMVSQGRLSTALQRLEQATAQWEFCTELHLHLGLLYRRMTAAASNKNARSGDESLVSGFSRHDLALRAEQEFGMAVALAPTNSFAYAARASARMNLADLSDSPNFESAWQDIEEALRLDPSLPAAHINKISLLRREDKDAAADALTNDTLALPNLNRTDRLYILRGYAERLRSQKAFEDAVRTYKEGLDVRPTDLFLLCGLARTYSELPEPLLEEAIRLCDIALDIDPENTTALLTKAIACAPIEQRREEALKILRALYRRDLPEGQRGQVCHKLATALSTEGNVTEAFLVLDAAPERTRDHPSSKKNLSRWWKQLESTVPVVLDAITSKSASQGELSTEDESKLRMLSDLPFQLAGRARFILAKALIDSHRAGSALSVLRHVPRRVQNEEYRQLLSLATTAHRGPKTLRKREGLQISFLADDGSRRSVSCKVLEDFLAHLMDKAKLPIAEVIADAKRNGTPIGGERPVFLKAATGVGKTVITPLYVYCELVKRIAERKRWSFVEGAQVIVVEPRIAIAENEALHLNREYLQYLQEKGEADVSTGVYGCITSTTGRRNGGAPVVFVTTGVFESMARSIGDGDRGLHPHFDRIIIDEAHVTLPNNPGVELAIALCRQAGVVVDCMSATVDDTDLKRMLGTDVVDATQYQRFDVEWVNTHAPMSECLVSLVRTHLLERTRLSTSLQKFDLDNAPGVRAIGMLVVVNSHQSENSDTLRFVRLLEQFRASDPVASKLEIRRLASPILRDPSLSQEFARWQDSLDSRAEMGELPRYVIITTNVVEMGVTFPSLDFVVTMDTEIVTEAGLDGSEIKRVPISVSALTQRAGRAGRKRPGMCFITREDVDLNSDKVRLSDLSPEELASAKSAPERLLPPLITNRPVDVAYLAFRDREFAPSRWRLLNYLPSAILDRQSFEARLRSEMDELVRRGIASRNGLTEGGEQLNQLPPGLDQQFGLLLIRASGETKLPVAVMAAAGETSLGDLIQRHRALSDGAERGTRMARGVRFAFEESVGEVEGPNSTVISLGMDAVQATRILRSKQTDGLAELLDSGLNEVQATQIARLMGRGFAVIGHEELAGPEPDDRTARNAWNALVDILVKRIHFARDFVQLDSDSDLLSTYQIVRALVAEFPEAFGLKEAPSYLKSELHSKVREDLRAAEMEPGAVLALVHRALEVARDRRACGPMAMKRSVESECSAEEWRAACEVATLKMWSVAGEGLEESALDPIVQSLGATKGAKGADKNQLRLQLSEEGLRFQDNQYDALFLEFLQPTLRLARSRVAGIGSSVANELPVLTDQVRGRLLHLLRQSPYYGSELVLRRDGYGNYVAKRSTDGALIELNVSRTSVALSGDFVHVVGRLRPSHRASRGQPTEPAPDALSLSVSHVTALRRDLQSDEAKSRASPLGLLVSKEAGS